MCLDCGPGPSVDSCTSVFLSLSSPLSTRVNKQNLSKNKYNQSGSTILTKTLARGKPVYPFLWNAFSLSHHCYPFFKVTLKFYCREKATLMLAAICPLHPSEMLSFLCSIAFSTVTSYCMTLLTVFVSNRLWALLRLCLTHLCFTLNLGSISFITGALIFTASLFLSP